MVNHVETLLLNRSVIDIESSGRECPWYLDPSFNAVSPIPAGLFRAYYAILPNEMSEDDRPKMVTSVAGVIRGLQDFRPYLDRFDKRVTIRYGGLTTLSGLYKSMPESTRFVVDIPSFLSAAIVSGGLQANTGVERLDEMIGELVEPFKSSYEATVRFAAGVLMLACQLEAVRK